MRVTSDLWVSALVRKVFSAGGFAAVLSRGATEAGAIFVVMRGRMGEVALFGPAPQTSYEAGRPDDRYFVALPAEGDEAVAARLDKERRFDPDIWVVEIEAGATPASELIAIREP